MDRVVSPVEANLYQRFYKYWAECPSVNLKYKHCSLLVTNSLHVDKQ